MLSRFMLRADMDILFGVNGEYEIHESQSNLASGNS